VSEARHSLESPGTIGGKWGCALSAIVGIPLLGFAVAVTAMPDCLQNEPCDRSLDWGLIAGALAVTAIVGFGSRLLINAIARRIRSRG